MALGNDTGRKWTYAKVEEGKFNIGKGDEKKTFSSAEGRLESLTTYMDAAPGFEPKLRLDVVLLDGEDEAICVRAGMHTAFGRMLAGYIGGFSHGDPIRIEVSPGTDNPKVTSCFVKRQAADPESGEAKWVKADYTKVVGESTDEADAKAEAVIKGHACYKVFERKAKGGEGSSESGQEKARFLSEVKRAGMPDFSLYQKLYVTWFNRVRLATGATELAGIDAMADSDFTAFADWMQKKGDALSDRAAWPAELQKEADFDPFA